MRDELNQMSSVMHRVDEATGETPYGVIGKIAQLDEGECPRPDFRIAGTDAWSGDGVDVRARAVAALAALTTEHGRERDHVWRGTRRRLSEIDRQRLVERLRDGLARLATLHAALRAAAAAASVEDAESVRSAAGVAEHLDALDAMPGSVPDLLATEAVVDQPTTALDLCENVANAQELKANLVDRGCRRGVRSRLERGQDEDLPPWPIMVPMADRRLPKGRHATAVRPALRAAERSRRSHGNP